MSTQRQVHRYPNADALALAAAEMFTQIAAAAIQTNGRFTVALSGGSTPRALHLLLSAAPYRGHIAWEKVHVFWGDERAVLPDHPDSNYKMALDTLLRYVPIPRVNIYRIPTEVDNETAAQVYEQDLRVTFGDTPRFDLILLGMGDDGHTASLFPHTAALKETVRWVVPNYVEKLATWRITLTYPVLNAAANVMFLVAGADKRERLNEVLDGEYHPDELPSQGVQPTNGELHWLVAVD
jgi:6-phosphogluconolactonase